MCDPATMYGPRSTNMIVQRSFEFARFCVSRIVPCAWRLTAAGKFRDLGLRIPPPHQRAT